MSYVTNQAWWQHGVAGKGLFAAAALGLGFFMYSALASEAEDKNAETELLQLRQQIETITAERDQVAKESDRRILAGQSLHSIQVQIEAATGELQQLDELRANVSQAIEQARLQLTGPTSQCATPEESPTGTTTPARPLSKGEIRAGQEALIDLGYGKLEADGLLGPTTRKAVKAFERARSLPVTGKLGTATLQALKTHTASAAQ
jgi:hypothetical protein